MAVVTLTGWLATTRFRSALASSPSIVRFPVGVSPAERLLGVTPDERRLPPFRPSRWAIAWAPDGSRFVFTALRGQIQQMYVRALDRLEAEPIAGTENSDTPFFSPDGRWLGFWQGGEIRKMPADGGPVERVCAAAEIVGASWGSNDVIVFGSLRGGLWRVPSTGGTPQQLTSIDPAKGEFAHRLPHVLPGGKAVLFTALGSAPRVAVRLLETEAQTTTTLFEEASDARYVGSGHIVYVGRGATLMAAPFDLERRQLTGNPVGLLNDVMHAFNAPSLPTRTAAAQFSIADTGALLYVPGGVYPESARALVVVDRTGSARELSIEPRPYVNPRLSPDGTRVAPFAGVSIWIYDISRGTTSLFERAGSWPIWTRDGKQITHVEKGGLFLKPVDGSGPAQPLATFRGIPESWSRNGELAITHEASDWNISVLSAGDSKRMPQPFAADSPANERYPDFSPDGRWLAYTSNESGREEIYVRPYPGPGERLRVSINGGTQPAWSRTSGELFFTVADRAASTDANTVMVVDVTTTPTFKAGIPRALPALVTLTVPMRGYDVSGDGQRFFTLCETKATMVPSPTQMIVVLNWVEELKRRVPSK